MTVEEIKAKCPSADVYVLDPSATLIIVLDKRDISIQVSKDLGEAVMRATGRYPIIVRTAAPHNTVRLLEIHP